MLALGNAEVLSGMGVRQIPHLVSDEYYQKCVAVLDGSANSESVLRLNFLSNENDDDDDGADNGELLALEDAAPALMDAESGDESACDLAEFDIETD